MFSLQNNGTDETFDYILGKSGENGIKNREEKGGKWGKISEKRAGPLKLASPKSDRNPKYFFLTK